MRITIGNKKAGDKGEYVGRGSPLGNPFPLPSESKRDECIERYKEWLEGRIEEEDQEVVCELWRLADILRLNGEVTLLCWCAPKRCHAEVIAALLEEMTRE